MSSGQRGIQQFGWNFGDEIDIASGSLALLGMKLRKSYQRKLERRNAQATNNLMLANRRINMEWVRRVLDTKGKRVPGAGWQ